MVKMINEPSRREKCDAQTNFWHFSPIVVVVAVLDMREAINDKKPIRMAFECERNCCCRAAGAAVASFTGAAKETV